VPKQPARIAHQIISDARHQPLRELSADVLHRMLADAEETRDRLADEIAELGDRWSEARDEGRWTEMRSAREHILL
jgi:hypothetical protein